MSKNGKSMLAAASLALAAAVSFSAPSLAVTDFAGKTVTIVVGFPGGSPATLIAQMLAKELPDHIPGNPDVIVQNMPGGSGITASNFLAEKAEPDGLTLTYGPWFPIYQIIERPGFRFKYEDLTFIAGNSHTGRLVYARTDSVPGGLESPADIVKAENLRLGGSNPAGANDLRARLSFDVIGVPYRYIGGFQGTSRIDQALAQGEVDADAGTIVWYRSHVEPNLVEPGTVMALWHFPLPDGTGGFKQNPYATDIPTFQDVYAEVRGGEPSGEKWDALEFVLNATGISAQAVFGPPGMDEETTAVLRKAVSDAMQSPGWIEASNKTFGLTMTPANLDAGLAEIDRLRTVTPEMKQFLTDYVAEIDR